MIESGRKLWIVGDEQPLPETKKKKTLKATLVVGQNFTAVIKDKTATGGRIIAFRDTSPKSSVPTCLWGEEDNF